MVINNTCVAFGTFQFVHRGHRKIVEKVVEIARERNLTSVIVSLEQEDAVYTTEEEKEYFLKSLGVEMVLSFGEIPLDQLLSILLAKVVVVGEGYKELETLMQVAEKLDVEVVMLPTEKYSGISITSDLVREAFEAADFEKVTELCGQPYSMIGHVVHGKALGRTEKMPTANIELDANKIKPRQGVYATKIRLDEEYLSAVTNIGTRPSVDDFDYVTVEALILDFEREIYGEKLVLEVHSFIRDTMKFESLAEVKAQVDKDVKKVRESW